MYPLRADSGRRAAGVRDAAGGAVLIRYFDASALVKRYFDEANSSRVERWLRSDSPKVTSRLSEVEIASALARVCRERRLDSAEYESRLALLEKDLRSLFFVIEMRRSVIAGAVRLMSKHPLRAGDAIQLASALGLLGPLRERPARFVCFDSRLSAAALAEGFELEAA